MGLSRIRPPCEATSKPLKPLLANDYPPAQPGHTGPVFEGTNWPASGMPVRIPDQDLVRVDSTQGTVLYALRWDQPPYDRLFSKVDAAWQPHVPIRGVRPDGAAR